MKIRVRPIDGSLDRWIATGGVLLAIAACAAEPRTDARTGAASSATPAPSEGASLPVILFLGTSLTAGYGLSDDEAYPALIQAKLDSAGLRYQVVNAGVSGETSAGGLRRIDWLVRQPVAVLVLELGANDGLRGQDIEAMRANLQGIIDRTKAAHPQARILVAGMEAPPNMGRAFTDRFRRVFPDVAAANEATLIPFLLEGVAAVPELNQADGIHPTAEGQRIVAETVWRYLEPLLDRTVEDGRRR
jgi:acyl-CoA thioesterase-1